MGDIQRADEKPTESLVESDGKNAEPGRLDDAPKKPIVKLQHVIITLADGRRGVFMGPEFIKEVEMKLNLVPKLVSVDFDPPREVIVPEPRPVPTDAKEAASDPKVESQPAPGLE